MAAADIRERARDKHFEPERADARVRDIVARGQPVKGDEVPMLNGRTYLRDHIPLQVDGRNRGRLWHLQDITGLKVAERGL